jgi:hypothetical protein
MTTRAEQEEQDSREEAERLKLLPRAVQRQVIALHQSTADDSSLDRADRAFARRRVSALKRFLRLG